MGETLSYTGGMKANSSWDITEELPLTLSASKQIGPLVRGAQAIVDKANGKISLVVEERDGQNVIKSAAIVEAINDAGSEVIINADHIDLSGTVTFHDLETEGESVINGGNITAGSINADYISGGSISASNISLSDDEETTRFSVDDTGRLITVGGNISTQALQVSDDTGTVRLTGSEISNVKTAYMTNVETSRIRLGDSYLYPNASATYRTERGYAAIPTVVGGITGT